MGKMLVISLHLWANPFPQVTSPHCGGWKPNLISPHICITFLYFSPIVKSISSLLKKISAPVSLVSNGDDIQMQKSAYMTLAIY